MAKSCLFGIFVFGSQVDLNYRFLSSDLFTYFFNRFKEDQRKNEGATRETDDIAFVIDDAITLYLSTLINLYAQTRARNSPIKRITLESNIQIFFDQFGENRLLCMADGSFDTLVVLKTINLFKALIKFHIGAFPFVKSPTLTKSIDRISASLQYHLNHITTNQSLLFESSEYLNLSPQIRQQCTEACLLINLSIQFQPTMIIITCKDKIVHMQLSNEQNRPSNSDIFLLLLNNTSRSLRTQFQSEERGSFSAMAHVFQTSNEESLSQSATTRMDHDAPKQRRTTSLPTITRIEAVDIADNYSVEVIFMKTSKKLLAPFTMYTIPLTDDISVLTLVEWKNSIDCSSLSKLINQLNLCITQLQLSRNKLNDQVRAVESNNTTRKYYESRNMSSHTLMKILDDTYKIYKAQPRSSDEIDEEHQHGNKILKNLDKMCEIAIDIFHKSFFHLDEDDQSLTASTHGNNKLDSSTLQILQNKLASRLSDWFAFIEIKAQGNITISFCQHDFPGLVHFALIDRSRGRICTPVLFTEDYRRYLAPLDANETENIKEKKIINFELECLSALQRGCTSYTVTDEYFTYNYTLRLQESNGASMKLHKPFVKAEPPGILHYDFYEKLAYENYALLGDQTTIACFELICVHLRFVPPGIVREHCEQLWPKLMELDE